MTGAFSWLPADAVAPPLAQGALADMADAWSREWFAGEQMRALGTLVRIAEPRAALRRIVWHAAGGLAIGVPEAGVAALGARVLGIAMAGAARPRADTDLLVKVGGECLDDLKRRAAAVLGMDKPAWSECEGSGGGAVHRLEIGEPGRDLVLVLELSAELFARFVKAKLAAAPTPAPLGAPSEALAPLPVALSALLGRCGVTVAELAGLAEGDVLVLDRALDASLPLAVQGVPARRGSCRLSEIGDTVALKIIEAPAT